MESGDRRAEAAVGGDGRADLRPEPTSALTGVKPAPAPAPAPVPDAATPVPPPTAVIAVPLAALLAAPDEGLAKLGIARLGADEFPRVVMEGEL